MVLFLRQLGVFLLGHVLLKDLSASTTVFRPRPPLLLSSLSYSLRKARCFLSSIEPVVHRLFQPKVGNRGTVTAVYRVALYFMILDYLRDKLPAVKKKVAY